MKRISLALVTLASASAFAAGKSNTEYYFQPASGAQAVEVKYRMDIQPAKSESAGVTTDEKAELNDLYLNYAYGLNDNNAVGAEVSLGNDKTSSGTTSHTATGAGDIHAFYKGFSGIWRYGADLGVNLNKIKIDSATNLPDNRSSGGMSVRVDGGVLLTSGEINYGANLAYAIPLERQVDNADVKITGGNTLKIAPFVEYNWGMGFVGAELAYNMVSDSTLKAGGTDTTVKGESYTTLLANGSYDFNETVTGLLSLGMGLHPEHDEDATTKAKAYTETIASLGVRMNF